jgi:hypothetical protein
MEAWSSSATVSFAAAGSAGCGGCDGAISRREAESTAAGDGLVASPAYRRGS